MTKNTIGGSGHKKSKKTVLNSKSSTPYKEYGCDYAFVLDTLGAGNMKVFCYSDKRERIAHIRGSMYKKIWIAKEDIVLVSLRDFENNKCDIIYKYNDDEIKKLVNAKEIEKNYVNIARRDNISFENNVVFADDVCNIDDI